MPLAHQSHLRVDTLRAALLRSVSLVDLSPHLTPRYELRRFIGMPRWRGFRPLPKPVAALCRPPVRTSPTAIDYRCV